LSSIFSVIDIVVLANSQPLDALHVSLPDGTIVGADPDPWLDQGWLLNITAHYGNFVVRINDTGSSFGTYDTHLIIALNDIAYDNLVSLYVDSKFPTQHITIPKTAFQYGVPKPYDMWMWPGDVYPTWFNDTLVNLKTIRPFSTLDYKDVNVSVTFSNATGARMHFDAYGSTSCHEPIRPDHIVRNPDSKDSTVIFSPTTCDVTFLTDPVCSGYNITFAGGTYHNGTSDTFAYGTSGPATANCPDGWVFDHWEVTGNVEVSNAAVNPTCVTITCGGTLKAVFKSACACVALFTTTQHSPKVTFNALSSYDPDGYIVSYTWNFGDGNTTTVIDPIIIHNYNASGTYNVTLTVIDNDSLSHSATNSLTIRMLVADLNSDGIVNIIDIATVAKAFGTKEGELNWNEMVDMDGNGIISIVDIATVAKEYGKTT